MRRKKQYFKYETSDPLPLEIKVKKRISFSEVDAMAIVWHGRYPLFFEMAAEELGRKIGLSYDAYRKAGLRAPIVQHHIDYHAPLELEEEAVFEARLIWDDAARLNMEFTLRKENGTTAATGYTVQMFVDASTGTPCVVLPQLYREIREKWRNGELYDE